MTLSAAACLAGTDPERMAALPVIDGMPNEIVIPREHRSSYDRAYELARAELQVRASPSTATANNSE